MATLSGDAFFESPSGDGSFGVAASPPLLCVFSSSGTSGASTASARAPARVVSGALAPCETPPLAALLGVGGGDARSRSRRRASARRATTRRRASRRRRRRGCSRTRAPRRRVRRRLRDGHGGRRGGGRARPRRGPARLSRRRKRRQQGARRDENVVRVRCGGARRGARRRRRLEPRRDVRLARLAARRARAAPRLRGRGGRAPPSPRARAAHGAGDAASFRADPEGRATAAMRSLSLGAASAREPSALVVGWGLRPLDACAHGAAGAAARARWRRGPVEVTLCSWTSERRARTPPRANPSANAPFSFAKGSIGIVECAAPRGPAGFAVLAAASPRAALAGWCRVSVFARRRGSRRRARGARVGARGDGRRASRDGR